MDNSFAVQFNPISTVKTVKEYEQEIVALKNEVFELKHKMSQGMKDPIGDKMYEEKMKSEKNQIVLEFRKDVAEKENRIGLLEQENKNLLAYLETMNGKYKKIHDEISQYRDVVVRREQEYMEAKNKADELLYMNQEMKNHMNNMEGQINELRHKTLEYEKLFSQYGVNNVDELNHKVREREEYINELKAEIQKIREQYETEKNKFSGNEVECRKEIFKKQKELDNERLRYERIIKELKVEIDDIKEDQKDILQINREIEDLQKKNETLEEMVERLESEKNQVEKNLFTAEKKMEAESKRHVEIEEEIKYTKLENDRLKLKINRLIEKVKTPESQDILEIEKRLNNFIEKVKQKIEIITHRAKSLENKISQKNKISPANTEFIKKLGLSTKNINTVLSEVKLKLEKTQRKNHLLENQVKELTFFAENNQSVLNEKSKKIFEEFVQEFNTARNELIECQEYLLKKGNENKSLKKQIKVKEKEIKILKGVRI